jgi:thiol-disulfide isomerase/thioredoxin
MFYDNLFIVLCLLIGVLLIQQFIGTTFYSTIIDKFESRNRYNTPENMKRDIDKVVRDAQNKINKAVEEGIREGFQNSDSSSVVQDINPSYLNKSPQYKLQLFYKPSCGHCKKFMPTWHQIINNLPINTTYEEINCDQDRKRATENAITSVPTIMLVVNDTKTTYFGDRSYNDIDRFLRKNGVVLVQRQFEDFDSVGELINSGNVNGLGDDGDLPKNPHCPAVSFDKQIDIPADKYLFQIFNADGQYGYTVGGYNEGNVMTPFSAAYSTIDSYLSSLPDGDKYIDECAGVYAENIINFGLCDAAELEKIATYQKKIKNGEYKARVAGSDYSSNDKIIGAIKKVCNM